MNTKEGSKEICEETQSRRGDDEILELIGGSDSKNEELRYCLDREGDSIALASG